MPPGEKGFVYSTVKKQEGFLALLKELFPENYHAFIENPQNPSEFGTNIIPDSIAFPGFIFDSKKEVRWYISGSNFFVTVISDESIPNLPEVEGSWTRERVAEYIQEPEQNKGGGMSLVKPNSGHINIKSMTLVDYLKKTEVLENTELFSRDAVPVFLTLRRWEK